jgi:parvulin-like peptidyl-prolyl isomerase
VRGRGAWSGRPIGRPFLSGLLLGSLACGPALSRRTALPPDQVRAQQDAAVERALSAEARRLGLEQNGEGPARLARARHDALLKAAGERLDAALVEPTEAEVADFLTASRSIVSQPERLRLRHVFRRIPAQATAEQRATALRELAGIRERILAGEDMGALARAHSDSETAKFEGLIAPQARGQLPPAVETIVWQLAVGELSALVDTPIGAHVFRLEERLAAEELPAEQQRDWARLRLRVQARERARAAEQERLLLAAGAELHPEALAAGEPAGVALTLGPLTVGELERLRDGLGFVQRRTTSLSDLLASEAWARLLEWDLAQGGRSAPEREAVARAEQAARAGLARDRRLLAWRDALPEAEVRARFEAERSRFTSGGGQRLRVLVRRREPGRPIHGIYEHLDTLARKIRLGAQDLATAARESSDDPSAAQGGDLGLVGGIDLGLWVGPTTAARIAALPVGELSGPLLVEVYREEKLAYEPEGYLLVRVEERQQPRPLEFEAAAGRARELLAAERAAEALAKVRADVLSGR